MFSNLSKQRLSWGQIMLSWAENPGCFNFTLVSLNVWRASLFCQVDFKKANCRCFGHCTRMVDDFAVQEVRSSGELWSEICSSLPEVRDEASEEKNTEFKDCFQPAAPVGEQVNGRCEGTNTSSTTAKWEPMEDSEIYIASLGALTLPSPLLWPELWMLCLCFTKHFALLMQRTVWGNWRVSPATWRPGTCCVLCLKQRRSAGIDFSTMPRPLSSSKEVTWMKGKCVGLHFFLNPI